jgi:hypothetical protein
MVRNGLLGDLMDLGTAQIHQWGGGGVLGVMPMP